MNIPKTPEERKEEILEKLRALIDAEQRRSGNPWHACLGTRIAEFDLRLYHFGVRPVEMVARSRQLDRERYKAGRDFSNNPPPLEIQEVLLGQLVDLIYDLEQTDSVQ